MPGLIYLLYCRCLQVERISTVKCPRDLPKVQDIDWAASDRPVLSCADGTVRVMDMHFLIGSSPFEDGQLTGEWTELRFT